MTIDKGLPAGVQHLGNTLYRVRLSVIQTADGGFDPAATALEFKNPRWYLDSAGQQHGRGFTVEEMEDLREAIRTEGLNHPLRCRWFPYREEGDRHKFGVVQLVDGERRFRSLSKMVKDNVDCFDPDSRSWVSAKQLYEWVNINLSWITDDEALTIALAGNSTALDIGTGAQVGLVKHLRQIQYPDDRILAITRKSKDWLLKTEKLFALDEASWAALCDDRINRKVAMTLLEEADLDRRAKILERSLAATEARLTKLRAELTDADLDVELARAEQELAPDEKAVQQAQAKLGRATKRRHRATGNLARPRAGISSGKDLAVGTDAETGPKPLTPARVTKYLYEPAVALVRHKGRLTKEGDEQDIDVQDARLVKGLLDLMREASGDMDTLLVRFLRSHKQRKEKAAAAPAPA